MEVHEVMNHSENLSLKYHGKKILHQQHIHGKNYPEW